MVASVGGPLAKPKDTGWYVDSGASMHMSPFRDSFMSFKETQNVPVRVGNNDVVYATSVGSILNYHTVGDQTVDVLLNDVLFVPDLSNNLFSTSSCMKHGINVIFSDDQVVLKSKNGQVLGIGIMRGSGIFCLMLSQESTEVKHSAMVTQSQ